MKNMLKWKHQKWVSLGYQSISICMQGIMLFSYTQETCFLAEALELLGPVLECSSPGIPLCFLTFVSGVYLGWNTTLSMRPSLITILDVSAHSLITPFFFSFSRATVQRVTRVTWTRLSNWITTERFHHQFHLMVIFYLFTVAFSPLIGTPVHKLDKGSFLWTKYLLSWYYSLAHSTTIFEWILSILFDQCYYCRTYNSSNIFYI